MSVLYYLGYLKAEININQVYAYFRKTDLHRILRNEL